eukprot:3861382-Rhodomonas_salina.3
MRFAQCGMLVCDVSRETIERSKQDQKRKIQEKEDRKHAGQCWRTAASYGWREGLVGYDVVAA